MDQKTIDDAQAAAAAKLADAKAEWSKTRTWRHDRWQAIKADPAAAACMFIAGVALAEAAPLVVKFIGWVVK